MLEIIKEMVPQLVHGEASGAVIAKAIASYLPRGHVYHFNGLYFIF